MADDRLLLDSNSRNVIGGRTTGNEIRNVQVDEQGRTVIATGTATIGTVTIGALSSGSNTIGTVTIASGSNTVGTATALQGGTWTVQPGNTQNTTPWSFEVRSSFRNITTNATTTLKSSSGVLHTLTINTRGTGSNVIVYDNTAGSGTTIATIDTTLSTTAFVFDAIFNVGLTVVTAGAGAADLTVNYR